VVGPGGTSRHPDLRYRPRYAMHPRGEGCSRGCAAELEVLWRRLSLSVDDVPRVTQGAAIAYALAEAVKPQLDRPPH
jgi:hypothetical protein